MWKCNDVVSVKYVDKHIYHIVFDDGMRGDVDFSIYLNRLGVFEALKDEKFFCSARVENGTISWPNGLDIAPETIYERLEKAK